MKCKYNPLASAIVTSLLLAASISDSFADVQYFAGNNSFNSRTGKPSSLTNLSSSMPSDLLSRVLNKLPEGQPIGNDPSKLALLTDDKGANLKFIKDATVSIIFVAEGAGYQNAISFFNFPSGNLDTLTKSQINDKVVFPNFSAVNSGGGLAFGDAVNIGTVLSGTSLGFTVFANAWGGWGFTSTNNTFRTIKSLNPEGSTNNLNAHTVLLSSATDKIFVIGFEDLNRVSGSDNDFNDAIVAIKVDPYDAVDTGNIITLDPTPTPTPTPTPYSASGIKDPVSWREVTTPPTVVDPIKEAKKVAKTTGNGNGN